MACLAREQSTRCPTDRLCPSEYRTKPWPEEAPKEGWFPLFAREQKCFDLVEDAIESHSRRERPSSALASGSDANRGRVADREAHKARCTCLLNAGKPRRVSQQNPDKPRRTCRLGANAYVEEGSGRSGSARHRRTTPRRLLPLTCSPPPAPLRTRPQQSACPNQSPLAEGRGATRRGRVVQLPLPAERGRRGVLVLVTVSRCASRSPS